MEKRYAGVTLSTEFGGEVEAPSFAEVAAGIEDLTPDGGPSFLILDGPGDAYFQTAGGSGSYAVERRVYAGSAFRHDIAGRHEEAADEWVSIPTRRARVNVRPSEEMRLNEVKVLLPAYLNGGAYAAGFVWRDKSDDLDN